MNIDHEPVACTLYDYYAGDWVDSLDELKTNTNERMVTAKAGAYALGRKTDELIISALDASTNYAGADTDGLTKAKVLEAFEMLGEADVAGRRRTLRGRRLETVVGLDDHRRVHQRRLSRRRWNCRMEGHPGQTLAWRPLDSAFGLTKKRRRSILLLVPSRPSVTPLIGQNVQTDISWHSDRAAFFINNSMSQGTCLVDVSGVVSMRCLGS